MRLTLRTLLAYLDDVLDPVDKEELAQKIESSEFAEDLVHRTRDTVRRLRLSAPQVIGTGMGLDPNTVGEYLDNVMPPEQVGDFERICLESDVHLAEATACHHVLTMVLGEPADVDPLARQRMYTIVSEASDRKRLRVEPAHLTPAASVAAALPAQPVAMPSAVVVQQPRAVEIPEYLRAGAWWRSTSAVIALATIVLIGTAIVFVSGLSGWFGGAPTMEPLTAENSAPGAESNSFNAIASTEPPMTETRMDSTGSAATQNAAPGSLAPPPQPTTPGIAPLAPPPSNVPTASNEPDRYSVNSTPTNTPPQQPATTDIAATPPPAGPGTSTPNPTETAPLGDPASNAPTPPATSTPPPPIPSTPAAPVASIPPTSSPTTLPVALDTTPSTTPPATGLATSTPVPPSSSPVTPPLAPVGADSKAPAEATAPAAPLDSGTYMGGKTVLLRHDDKAGTWFRVEPRAAVMPGERVLSLPEFRPKITLISGLSLDMSGGTQMVMGPANDAAAAAQPSTSDNIPSLELVYGRAVLINPSNSEKQVQLKLGPSTGVGRLAHNTTLAVEVERKHVPGQDPRQSPAPVEIRLFAPDGGIVWRDAAGEKTIDKPSRWTVTAAGATEVADDASPPEWIDHEPIVQLSEQRYGAPLVESTLVSNIPVDTQLLEMFQGSSRKEVKSLVARSSIHVGLFEPFIDALRDSEQKANWRTHIDTLRAAMALSPESAGKVWQALVDQRGKPAATDLYEMLCGYNADQVGHSPEQIKTGSLVKLINWLEDDSLDYRVLAVQDLWEITGMQLMPNPAAKLAERTQNVRRWRTRLENGELKLASPKAN